MPRIANVYRELGDALDMRSGISDDYERSVAAGGRVLDIGGQNSASASGVRLRDWTVIDNIHRILRPGGEAFIYVPDILTYGTIERAPRLHFWLARAINRTLASTVRVTCAVRPRDYTAEQAVFFLTYLNFNHGFCAWVRK